MNIKNITITLLFSLMVFAACKNNEQGKETAKSGKIPFVSIQKVKVQKIVSSITITGTVEANIFSDIVSPVDGVIDELRARENQQVKKGGIIAIINPNERVSLIAETQLKVENLQQELKAINQNNKDYAETKNQLDKALSDLEYAGNMYQTVPVICPVNGMITNRLLNAGAQVNTKDKILTITNMSSLVIKAEVNEKYFEAVKQGRKLPVILSAYPVDTIQGQISLVYPQVDPVTRSVKFDIKLLNFNKKILPGMMASIKIPVSSKENAIAIPEQAVLTSPDNKNFLFVVNKDTLALKRLVQTGISSGNKLEIIKGLKENDKVIVAGQEMLKDSVKVKIMKNK